jgi:hypothetical protein
MADQRTHHAEIEKRLQELLRDVIRSLAPADLAEAAGFLAAGEYGLCLEAIAAGLVDRREHLQPRVVQAIDHLAQAMELTGRPFLKDVHAFALRAS